MWFPGLKALGYSLFALRATANVQTARTGVSPSFLFPETGETPIPLFLSYILKYCYFHLQITATLCINVII